MQLSGILAVSENHIIGSDNDLPWRLSNDLKWFKKNTLNKPMIMGRKTFQSLPGLLPNRTHIVLTRDESYAPDNVLTAHSAEQATEFAKQDAEQNNQNEIMIIGGGEMYRLFEPLITRFYLTQVHAVIDGDTEFAPLDEHHWQETFRTFNKASDKDQFDHTFCIYERKNEN
ncbi:hypothetical protein A9Q83_10285 [Alphaproteobacteria bacterium 46_93_T64]|nr:hypothetical protein A9Q83_10285 [Alphaproteobacteria bacterium 46_93_T64]